MSVKQIDTKALSNLDIVTVITDDYHICCILSDQTLYTARKPWYIFCSDILPQQEMKVFCAVVSGLIFFLSQFTYI